MAFIDQLTAAIALDKTVYAARGKVDASKVVGIIPPANLPVATAAALGVVKIGAGVSITSPGGVLSAP